MDESEISKPKAYIIIALLAVSLIGASMGISKLAASKSKSVASTQTASIVTSDGFTKKINFPNVPLSAKAAVVYDVKNREVLFEKNGEAQLPLASLSKIMTALTARELLPEDAIVTVRREFLMEEGDSGFKDGEEWLLKDILDLTLAESSNDGAAAIAGAWSEFENGTSSAGLGIESDGFIKAMNAKASELGLYQTYFLNETGLDDSLVTSGGYGSVRDMARLFSHAVLKFPDAFEATRFSKTTAHSVDNTEYEVKNTNSFVDQIPGIIASKTGYTDLAGGNLFIMFDAGPMRPIVVGVLGSTSEGRFEDVSALVSSALRYIKESEL